MGWTWGAACRPPTQQHLGKAAGDTQAARHSSRRPPRSPGKLRGPGRVRRRDGWARGGGQQGCMGGRVGGGVRSPHPGGGGGGPPTHHRTVQGTNPSASTALKKKLGLPNCNFPGRGGGRTTHRPHGFGESCTALVGAFHFNVALTSTGRARCADIAQPPPTAEWRRILSRRAGARARGLPSTPGWPWRAALGPGLFECAGAREHDLRALDMATPVPVLELPELRGEI